MSTIFIKLNVAGLHIQILQYAVVNGQFLIVILVCTHSNYQKITLLYSWVKLVD